MTDEELIADCKLAASVMAETETFEVGQSILLQAADRIEALVNEAVLSKVAYEGVSSLLLSVQQDCIKERQRAERLEAALRFYARRGVVSPWVDDEIDEDGGVVARAALKGDKP